MNDSTLTKSRQPAPPPARPITDDDRREIIAAASMASPIGELQMQAFGGRTDWNQHVRPGRSEARRKFLLVTLRAAEIALAEHPQLEVFHVVASIRSHALNPVDVLIDQVSGKWLVSTAAVKKRGIEYARSIAELALIVWSIEQEACKAGKEAA